MRNSGIKRIIVTLSCMLIIGTVLFLAACGASGTPASPGGGQNTPQSAPPGYSLIGVFSHEIPAR